MYSAILPTSPRACRQPQNRARCVITDAAHRLVSGLFVVEDRGAQALKGIERPVQLYRVVQPSGVRGRLEAAAAARGLTPFVGREDELRLLMNRWERALDGEGQVALIVGEAGIGKSRLVQRFHEQIAGTPHTWVEAAAGPFFQNTPFYAVTEMLRELLAWRGRRIGGRAARATGSPAGTGRTQACRSFAADCSALESADNGQVSAVIAFTRAAAPPLAGDVSRVDAGRRPSAADNHLDRRLALGRPFDAGADPTSRRARGDGAAAAPVHGAPGVSCTMAAAGPSYANHAQSAELAQCAQMVGQVAAQDALSDETVAAVIERTGGVPLFVEELTRAVLESAMRSSSATRDPGDSA